MHEKWLGIPLLLILLACNDGDLEISVIDFDDTTVQYCDNQVTTSTTLFFKLNSEEALILELQSGLLKNEESTQDISSNIPGQSQVTYRTFDGSVSSEYFCSNIPPVSPKVVDDILAENGQVLISTLRNETDTTLFDHTISLQNLSLIKENGQRITDLTTLEFGTLTTSE
ncbi:MAG: hypothetical protein KJO04_08910 [Bacteroidia bacterium]|nr:hypothetical protein [Bacteroidia bacterium]